MVYIRDCLDKTSKRIDQMTILVHKYVYSIKTIHVHTLVPNLLTVPFSWNYTT